MEIRPGTVLEKLLPRERADQFFEALYGDRKEGAYDIALVFKGIRDSVASFEFQLKERPGKCLACNLTYGLPEVFQRHPVIDLKGLVSKIGELFGREVKGFRLMHTNAISKSVHVIPLEVYLE
ncbi:MAG: pancreas/duodenum homeobox protein 1 [Desulfatiglandales bacterium]